MPIMEDFRWLGLTWELRAEDQSRRGSAYEAALERLRGMGLVYPCYCSRDQLHAASAPHASDGRVIYAGTCRHLTEAQRNAMTKKPAMRLMLPDRQVSFCDGLQGEVTMNLQKEYGDIIIRRADGVAAYQLAVVIDDGEEGVTQVVRGRDLLSSTPVQLYLYELLELCPPEFYHVPMLLAQDGRQLSKRRSDIDSAISEAVSAGRRSWDCWAGSAACAKWEKISARKPGSGIFLRTFAGKIFEWIPNNYGVPDRKWFNPPDTRVILVSGG